MRGFFDKQQLEKTPYKSEKGTLSCVSCGLYKYVMSPRMKPYGEFGKRIMVIGEAPGQEDDEKGKPWQGMTGKFLKRKFQRLGIDLFQDCISLNAVNCRPVDQKGNNKAPTEHEIACCRPKVIDAIKEYQPKLIILQGAAAVSSLITGYSWKTSGHNGIHVWRGWAIPDRTFNAWICPTFSPSFVENQQGEGVAELIWTQDLENAFAKLDETFPNYGDEKENVVISFDIEHVLKTILKDKPKFLAFDIEATGLKPYNKEFHRIVTISFCYEENRSYAIPFPTEQKQFKLLKRILEHPDIGKIAANMKYEDNWLNFLHNIEVGPWAFDTMQAAHVLDNRPGITGLKFQAYIRFGTPDYDSEVEPYLKSRDSNTPNRVMELVRNETLFRKLLLYNGIDSLVTYRLAMLQMRELGW
jgi:uracil-DNA glycosylase family 4